MKVTRKSGPRLYAGAYPSVTEVLKIMEKSYLDAWKHKVGHQEANKILRNASVFGTRVHSAAQAVAVGLDHKVDHELEPYADAVRKFLDEHVAEVIETELSIWSPTLRYGGTLDMYCKLKDGGVAVVDWKTSKSLSREHGLQTAAYAMLLRGERKYVNRRMVVRIKKDRPGEYYCRHFTDGKEDVKTFLSLVQVWHWKYGAAMRKRRERNIA